MFEAEGVKEKRPFGEHLEELRRRLLRVLLMLVAMMMLSFPLVRPCLDFLIEPVGKVVYLSPGEAVLVHLKLSLFLALFFTLPYFLWEGWQFVSKALLPSEKKLFFLYFPLALLAFCSGSLFAFLVVLPVTLHLFQGFASDTLEPMISIGAYISFVSTLLLSFGVVFEFPVVALFLSHAGVLTPDLLKKKWRTVILVVFILAAVLTPPDILSQLLMVVPLILLYSLSLFFSSVGCRLRRTRSLF